MSDNIFQSGSLVGKASIPQVINGAGIRSIEQTSTSSEDDGINTITITSTDGEQTTFNVKNGSKGSIGPQGEKGEKGDTGAAFTFDMFTAEQLASLKGEKGDTGPQGPKGNPGEGSVKTVNGISPDENGNVEVQAGINSADVARIVKNEFSGGVGYTETQVYSVTWNGDKTDKVSVMNVYYKVSDLTPDLDASAEFALYMTKLYMTQDETETKYGPSSLNINTSNKGFTTFDDYVVICYDSSKSISGVTFPETGIYFAHTGSAYVSKLEFTAVIVNTINKKYIPSTPEFVVDATNLPTDITAWGELCTALEDAYNSGLDIFLDVNGNGTADLKLTNCIRSDYLFLYPDSSNTIHAYILEAMPSDGGSLTEISLSTKDYVDTAISNALGVIENGTY